MHMEPAFCLSCGFTFEAFDPHNKVEGTECGCVQDRNLDNEGMYLVSVDGEGDSGEENEEETAALQVHPARSHPEVNLNQIKWDFKN